jgi:hypothetical protein
VQDNTPVTAASSPAMFDSSVGMTRTIVQANSLRSAQRQAGKHHLPAETRKALAGDKPRTVSRESRLVAGRPGQMRRRASPGDAVIEIARADDSRVRRTGWRPLRAHVELAAAGHAGSTAIHPRRPRRRPGQDPAQPHTRPAEAQRRASPLLRTLVLSWLSRPVRGGAVGNRVLSWWPGWWG